MKFNVLIIYSGQIANSPKDKSQAKPFGYPNEYYNLSYEYFLTFCKKNSISAAFSTSSEIIGPGAVGTYWIFKNLKWEKHFEPAFTNVVFNKFTPINKAEEKHFKILFSKKTITPFANPQLLNLFRDKYKTYKEFKEVTIPTALIGSLNRENFENAKKELKKIINKNTLFADFASELVVKDRFGAGGFKIIKALSSESFKDVTDKLIIDENDNNLTEYILQPFIKCDKGFIIGEHRGTIDVRVIVLNGKPVQSFIRVAKKGDFRANLHQGGKSFTLALSDIPKDVLGMVLQISKRVDIPHALYTLDFMKSNNGNVFFVEGNSTPGIDWRKEDGNDRERLAKNLINYIVKELKKIILEKKKIS